MPKRFTATEKWIDPWFCSLIPINKLFWMFLLDNCDHAGMWKVNWPLVKFHIWEEKIDPSLFGGRIVVINSEKWHIPKFIEFQYGELNDQNNTHKSVLKILEKEGVLRGSIAPHVGVQDKGLDKGLDKGVIRGEEKSRFLEFVYMTQGQHDQLAQKLGKTVLDEYVERLNNYVGSHGKKYKSHYHTILSWTNKDGKKPLRIKKSKTDCWMCSGTGKMKGGSDCSCLT